MALVSITTAGVKHGTPDWQLNLMVESESAEAWAKANQSRSDFDLHPCIDRLKLAISCIRNAENYLATAAGKVEGSPLDDKIMSLFDELDTFESHVNKQLREVEKLA